MYMMMNSMMMFNQPIGKWDVSSVTDMRYFMGSSACTAFNQDLSGWNPATTDLPEFQNVGCCDPNFNALAWLEGVYSPVESLLDHMTPARKRALLHKLSWVHPYTATSCYGTPTAFQAPWKN